MILDFMDRRPLTVRNHLITINEVPIFEIKFQKVGEFGKYNGTRLMKSLKTTSVFCVYFFHKRSRQNFGYIKLDPPFIETT